MNLKKLLIGYGTFIYNLNHLAKNAKVLGVCVVFDYMRIFHKDLEYWYPFVFPKTGHKFKAILIELRTNDILDDLDRYEGVPHLYYRTLCNAKFETRIIKSWIYIPTNNTIKDIQNQIEKFCIEKRQTIFKKDLWLEYLKEYYPETVKKYPDLFIPIKEE
ncbi:MAG: gamma-glutamylcyclotransferase [Candidatus Helarchaeota archaeon]